MPDTTYVPKNLSGRVCSSFLAGFARPICVCRLWRLCTLGSANGRGIDSSGPQGTSDYISCLGCFRCLSASQVFCRMADSFADIWASSAPTNPNPQQPQKKVGATVPQRRQQYDAFSILSASQPSSRPVANNQLSDQQGKQRQATSHGRDTFGDLFASSLDGAAASRNPARVNMTMAERAVLAQKAKQNNTASTQIKPAASSTSLWDGLDALARPKTASPRPPTSIQGSASARDSLDFEFGSLSGAAPATSPPLNKTSIENDDWGLHDFTSESRSVPAPTKLATGKQPTALWDLGPSEQRTSQSQPQVPSRAVTGTPSDFDFGDREDALLGGDNSDAEDTFNIRSGHSEHPEVDILGDLGKLAVRNLHIRHVRRIIADMCAYTLVTLSFAFSKPIHLNTGPCSPTPHECLATSTRHRPVSRNGILAR
jgi:hypothetical protein